MTRESKDQHRNREAESAHVRKTVWGDKGVDDDVGDTTVLGDIHVDSQKSSGSMWPIVAAFLAGMLPLGMIAAGLLGWWLSNQDTPPMDDETVQIGLGRIEDYTIPAP